MPYVHHADGRLHDNIIFLLSKAVTDGFKQRCSRYHPLTPNINIIKGTINPCLHMRILDSKYTKIAFRSGSEGTGKGWN